jgi:transcriptional regulator with PAS, ATPase and Fis domain
MLEMFFGDSARHTISEYALEELFAYTWPGNVRELENVIERRLIQSAENPIATFGLVPNGDTQEERDARLRMLLRRHGGDTGAVAQELNVDRRTVQRHAKSAGIDLGLFSS